MKIEKINLQPNSNARMAGSSCPLFARLALVAAFGFAMALTSCYYDSWGRTVRSPDYKNSYPSPYKEEEYIAPPEFSGGGRIDITSIKRVAVMPFEADCSNGYIGNNDCSKLASYATSNTVKLFNEMSGFTLVDTLEVKRLQASGQSLENYVDVIFTGKITNLSRKQSGMKLYVGNSIAANYAYAHDKRTMTSYNSDNKATHDTYRYTTDVTVNLTYSLKVTKDGSIIGPISGQGSFSRSTDVTTATYAYPSTDGLYEVAILGGLDKIRNGFVARKSTRRVFSGTGGMDVRDFRDVRDFTIYQYKGSGAEKEEMDKAYSYLRPSAFRCFFSSCAGIATSSVEDIKRAAEAYHKIYERYKNAEAAFNAFRLYQVLGDTKSEELFLPKINEKIEIAAKQECGSENEANESVSVEKVTFADSRDGKEYKAVVIGKQTWMAENLNYNASDSNAMTTNLKTVTNTVNYIVLIQLKRLAHKVGICQARKSGKY